MGNISKLIGSLVGGLLSFLVAKFALPAEWAGPEFVAAMTTVVGSVLVYFFPANKPA